MKALPLDALPSLRLFIQHYGVDFEILDGTRRYDDPIVLLAYTYSCLFTVLPSSLDKPEILPERRLEP